MDVVNQSFKVQMGQMPEPYATPPPPAVVMGGTSIGSDSSDQRSTRNRFVSTRRL